MEFFQKLKQRRLFRIVVTYLAGGWIVLQVIDQVTQQGIVPSFAYDLTLVWYLSGIPLALVLGWYHGEKGHQRVTRREAVLLLLFLAMGVTASVPVVSREGRRRMRIQAATENKLDLHHIAVLYFEDRSPGDSLQYLADGFTEALLDKLSTVPALHVVSRNGVAQFRGSNVASDSIARALNVGTLVEGSVDKEGGTIRVSVSLVDGESGAEFQHAGLELPASQLLAARDDLADETSRLLRQWLGEEVELSRTRHETTSVPAWAHYQRAVRKLKDANAALDSHQEDTAFADFDQADSLAARAGLVDSTWTDPPVLRARMAYDRAKVIAQSGDLHGAVPWIDTGLVHAAHALDIDANDARALEWRGSLEYLHYLLHVETDPSREDALHAAALKDLRRSVDINPRLASAYATLSHLYANMDDAASEVLAGRRAYEEDAYLQEADLVVWRLVTGSYDLGQFTEAQRWCDTGLKRFPDNSDFALCQLMVMTTPAAKPDPARAWRLVARVDSLAPKFEAQYDHLWATIYAGGVLARAGLQDSARSVLRRARDGATPEVDKTRWLHLLEGYMSTLVGDTTEALDQIQLWAAVNPGASFTAGWWWNGLRGNPRFEQIVAEAGGAKGSRSAGSDPR